MKKCDFEPAQIVEIPQKSSHGALISSEASDCGTQRRTSRNDRARAHISVVSTSLTVPATRNIRDGSRHAILLGRMIEGELSPARARSDKTKSRGCEEVFALVIITAQIRPRAWRSSLETTSAGRRFCASRSE